MPSMMLCGISSSQTHGARPSSPHWLPKRRRGHICPSPCLLTWAILSRIPRRKPPSAASDITHKPGLLEVVRCPASGCAPAYVEGVPALQTGTLTPELAVQGSGRQAPTCGRSASRGDYGCAVNAQVTRSPRPGSAGTTSTGNSSTSIETENASSLQDAIHRLCSVLLHVWQDMGVDAERDGDVGVSQHL